MELGETGQVAPVLARLSLLRRFTALNALATAWVCVWRREGEREREREREREKRYM